MGHLEGRRVVVAGASAGIGRSFAVQAVGAGADVVLGARRAEVLEDVVGEAGGGNAVVLDVCDPVGRAAFVAGAVEHLKEIDLVLLAVGWADLRPLAEVDDEAWARTLATNLIGVDRLVAALRPALAPEAVVAILSSETAHRPRRGLVPYAASKAALEATVAGWRVEHPGIRLSCVVVGATFPTDFGKDFDGDHLGAAMADWERHGLMQEDFMVPEDVAGCLVEIYGTALRFPGVGIDQIMLRSPSPVLGSGEPSTEPSTTEPSTSTSTSTSTSPSSQPASEEHP
jgi:NAD(P)-dependent dehydrogenase (short-subunit alcohol dehydrogenase family)